MKRELTFLIAVWKANLLAAMEFRATFISQVLGMMLNNAVYFVFWVIFFDRFKDLRGWAISDMFMLFGMVATSFGIGTFFFGNTMRLADVIAEGRLDYFLSLPRPVLLHTLASRSITSGLGDFLYGLISFLFVGRFSVELLLRFVIGVAFGTCVFVSFFVIVHSLAFWIGNASMLASQAANALVTFSLYPITLFDGTAKLLLFTLIPAAFIGAIPVEFVMAFSWAGLFRIASAAVLFLAGSISFFYYGLRRYESGSAIQVQM